MGWFFDAEPGSYYTLEDLREGRVTVDRLMGHRSPGLCGFFAEVVREFGGQSRDGVYCQPLRSRYHGG